MHASVGWLPRPLIVPESKVAGQLSCRGDGAGFVNMMFSTISRILSLWQWHCLRFFDCQLRVSLLATPTGRVRTCLAPLAREVATAQWWLRTERIAPWAIGSEGLSQASGNMFDRDAFLRNMFFCITCMPLYAFWSPVKDPFGRQRP